MVDPQRNAVNVSLSLILLLYLQITSVETKERFKCPIGFKLAYTKTDPTKEICYSRKDGTEKFTGKFENCTGNLFTWRLYNSLDFTREDPGKTIWTDYKSSYPGGPFVDWSYTSTTGEILETTYEVNRNRFPNIDEELCVVADPSSNFTAVPCHEKHHRYCFLEPYEKDDDEGCEYLTNGVRFWGPTPMCLTFVPPESAKGKSRSPRYIRDRARKKCEDQGGSLLGRGWMYSNYWTFSDIPSSYNKYPLNIEMNVEHTMMWWQDRGQPRIPPEKWHFENMDLTPYNGTLGAIFGDYWYLVNRTEVFANIICEMPLEIRSIDLNVSIQSGDELMTLTVNDTISKDDILCFTDSSRYYPQKVATTLSGINVYTIKAVENGYYWCTHKAYNTFAIARSNEVLFIKVKESTQNWYAVKIRLFGPYRLDSISELLKIWKEKLKQYVYYSQRYYARTLSDPNLYNNHTIMRYRSENCTGREWKDASVILKIKLKRLYLDAQTALLHVELHPGVKPVRPGQWEEIIVLYMKPVYYCDVEPQLALGMSRSTPNCKIHMCVGNYNDGVQIVETSQDSCYTPAITVETNVSDVTTTIVTVTAPMPTVTTPEPLVTTTNKKQQDGSSESSEELNETTTVATTEYSIFDTTTIDTPYSVSTATNEVLTQDSPIIRPPKPPPTTPPPTTTETTVTTTRPPPELNQVITDLEYLLNNETAPIMADIDDAFTQVDQLLDLQDVDISSDLLHLLDEVGARVDLNGSVDAATVRQNIALVVADAQPDMPVRGLRIAQRDYDAFSENAFEILRNDINDSQLTTSDSEVVVQLPESVATSRTRVSFVVFRDDKAFHGNGIYSVNSRVLSVNIENTTRFTNNEAIEIHLKPLIENLERNQSRTCAYWHFQEDGSAQWSQDGCTFIPASEGFLDTCRCEHLTHFAEILVSRTVFSEQNETALEILTVIGCCMSIFGLLLVGLTAVLFRSWRRDYSNKVWLQLSVSILLLSVVFLIVVFGNVASSTVLCTVTGVALHYAVLASFCWMLVAAVLSYRRLVTVFTRDASHKLLRAAAFAWGLPCAIIAILLSINPQAYQVPYEQIAPNGAFCYPTGLALWLAVFAPIAVMLLANWTLFALIVRSVFASKRIQRHGDTNEALRCASVSCLLVFLFGLPWIFGLFSFNVVAAYFFTILATFQGFVLFLFFVLGNKKTRDLWLNKLKIKQTRKIPVTSSTYTNRSTGAAANPRPNQTPAAIEANASKPKSLSSSDNGRFS